MNKQAGSLGGFLVLEGDLAAGDGLDIFVLGSGAGASAIKCGEMTLSRYSALNYSQNCARDLRCALNGA